MKISTNCSSLVILGDDFFSSPPFSFFPPFFFPACRINELPQQGTWEPFLNNKQINNKHRAERSAFLRSSVLSGAFLEAFISCISHVCLILYLWGGPLVRGACHVSTGRLRRVE